MDRHLLNALAWNRLISLLIVVQIVILLVIVSLLIWPVMATDTSLQTVMAAACMLLICLPLLVFQYLTSKNRELKYLFLGLLVNFIIFSASSIVQYTFPQAFGLPWMEDAGKALMLLVYPPVMVALYCLWKARGRRRESYTGTTVVIVNVLAAALVVIFVALNFYHRPGDVFNTANFTLSVIADIAILSLVAALAVVYMENQLRYVLGLLFIFYLISLAGDTLNLLAFLGLYAATGLAQSVYDVMVLFAGAGLLFYTIINVKVTTVEEVDRELRHSKSLIHDLLVQSPEAMCIFDAGGTAVEANRAFVQLSGIREHEIIGHLNIFRDGDRLLAGLGNRIPVLRDGGTIVTEGEVTGHTGGAGPGYYYFKISPAHDSGGKLIGYILIIVDITDHKKHEEALLQARAQAELYLDLMGHDISNMNQIGIGFLEMALARLDLDHEGQMMIRKPLEAMQNSSRLIDNVKMLQRASTGFPDLVPVDIGSVLDSVVKEYSDIRGRDVIIEYAPVRGCYVAANPLIRDVFYNVLNNAFKHSTGPLKVWIQVLPCQKDGAGYYRVSVEDNGPGMPDDVLQMLQGPLSPLHARTGGSGLGLYLVRTLVESYAGTVMAEDRVPGDRKSGTRIVVMLPAIENPGSPAGAIPGSLDDPSLRSGYK